MQIDDDQNLAPETLELLTRIAGRPGGDSNPLDEVMLAAFACGVSTPEQEAEMVSVLVRSRNLRTRLKEMQAQLETIRSTPFGQISDQAVEPVLVHCMRGAMQASMRVLCRARKICKDRGWSDIRQARDFEAKTVRAMLGAIGHAIQTSAGSGGDGASPLLGPGFPEGISAVVNAQIRADGSLVVSPVYSEKEPGALAKSGVGRLTVELVDPNGGSIPLGEHYPLSKAPLEAEGFSEIAGLEVGPIPARYFRLDIGDHPSLPTMDSGLRAGSAIFDLVEQPRIEREQLIVTLRAPDNWRDLANQTLEVMVPAGNLFQLVSRWPMADWGPQVQTLKCPLTGVIDGSVECGSVLRLGLV